MTDAVKRQRPVRRPGSTGGPVGDDLFAVGTALDGDEAGEFAAEDRAQIDKIKRGMRIRNQAKHELDAEEFVPPSDSGSLDDQYNHPAPEPEFIVGPRVIPKHGIVQVNAQWKAGKSTLIDVNLASDLASGDAFLGEFPVRFQRGNIGIWNLEVGPGTLQGWLFARDLPAKARRRIYPAHLRGEGVDLLVPQWAEWTESWLRDRMIKVWIIDPLSKMLRSENDASEFNAWWRVVELIMRRADVDLSVIVHHTGHGTGDGDAIPRARGSSAMQGNPDVLYWYRHGGEHGTMPPPGDTRRYFGGFGRDVEVPEMTLDFDPLSKRLTVVQDSKGRRADSEERTARRVAEIVWGLGAEERINATDLQSRLGAMQNQAKVRAVKHAVEMGWVAIEQKGKAKLHYPGSINPFVSFEAVRLDES